jgi:hypothetical protein
VRSTGLSLYSIQDIGMQYAYTLAEWRRRFHESLAEVGVLGFDETFCRMQCAVDAHQARESRVPNGRALGHRDWRGRRDYGLMRFSATMNTLAPEQCRRKH